MEKAELRTKRPAHWKREDIYSSSEWDVYHGDTLVASMYDTTSGWSWFLDPSVAGIGADRVGKSGWGAPPTKEEALYQIAERLTEIERRRQAKMVYGDTTEPSGHGSTYGGGEPTRNMSSYPVVGVEEDDVPSPGIDPAIREMNVFDVTRLKTEVRAAMEHLSKYPDGDKCVVVMAALMAKLNRRERDIEKEEEM